MGDGGGGGGNGEDADGGDGTDGGDGSHPSISLTHTAMAADRLAGWRNYLSANPKSIPSSQACEIPSVGEVNVQRGRLSSPESGTLLEFLQLPRSP